MKTWSYAEGHVPRWLTYLLPLLPAILASMLYVWLLSRSGMLPGIDGPYYAVQVRVLDATGSLKYPDPPLVFYLMLALYKASGNLFAAVRLGASIPTALASVPIYVFVRRLGASRAAALASASLFLLAPHTFRLVGDFMKNSAGMLWLSLMLPAMHRYLRGEGSLATGTIVLAALYLAAGLTHILDYGFMLVFGLLSPLMALVLGVPRRRVLAAAGAALVSMAVFASAPWLQGGDLDKALRISEETVSSLMSGEQAEPHRRLPFLSSTYLYMNWVSVLVLAAEAYLRRDRPWEQAVLGALAAVTAAFSLPLIPWRFLTRFQLMGSVPLAVSLGAALGGLRGNRGALMAAVVVGLVASHGVLAANAVAPSIPPGAYEELREIVDLANSTYPDPCYVVARPPLRYWVETLTDNVYARPMPGCRPLIFIGEPERIPPGARILFKGVYVAAWPVLRPRSS